MESLILLEEMDGKVGKIETETTSYETFHAMKENVINMLEKQLKPPTFDGQVL